MQCNPVIKIWNFSIGNIDAGANAMPESPIERCNDKKGIT